MKIKILEIANTEFPGGEVSSPLYYPLFPQRIKEETYLVAHKKLMAELRVQFWLKNRKGIERTGKMLHRLRRRYRARFAA